MKCIFFSFILLLKTALFCAMCVCGSIDLHIIWIKFNGWCMWFSLHHCRLFDNCYWSADRDCVPFVCARAQKHRTCMCDRTYIAAPFFHFVLNSLITSMNDKNVRNWIAIRKCFICSERNEKRYHCRYTHSFKISKMVLHLLHWRHEDLCRRVKFIGLREMYKIGRVDLFAL